MIFPYQVLQDADRGRLRIERVRSLEADLYRIELALEDALSTAEKDDLFQDAEIIQRRLEPHYITLGLPKNKDQDKQKNGEVESTH
jgi:hypothetical protein